MASLLSFIPSLCQCGVACRGPFLGCLVHSKWCRLVTGRGWSGGGSACRGLPVAKETWTCVLMIANQMLILQAQMDCNDLCTLIIKDDHYIIKSRLSNPHLSGEVTTASTWLRRRACFTHGDLCQSQNDNFNFIQRHSTCLYHCVLFFVCHNGTLNTCSLPSYKADYLLRQARFPRTQEINLLASSYYKIIAGYLYTVRMCVFYR